MDHKNRYPKTLHDAYTLLKGWKKNSTVKQHPMKLGVSFNTVGDGDKEETALVNQGAKYKVLPAAAVAEATIQWISALPRDMRMVLFFTLSIHRNMILRKLRLVTTLC